MPLISLDQFELVVNVFSFTIAAMGAAAIFLFLQRGEVAPRYRAVMAIVGLVPLIACYNYFRLYAEWNATYTVVDSLVKYTGRSYNDTFRYADWLLTVPLLVMALVLVLDLPPRQVRLRSVVLGLQAAEMILLGYPGQLSNDAETRWLWWGAAMVPFLIIIQQLYGALAEAVANQPPAARGLIVGARFMTVLVWCFYPVVYILPLVGVTGPDATIATQVGYAGADLLAKAVYGIMIYMICARKSKIERDAELPVAAAPALRAVRA